MQFDLECLDFYNEYASDIFCVISFIDNKLEFRHISKSVERIRGISVEDAMKEPLEKVFSLKSFEMIFNHLMKTVTVLDPIKEKEEFIKSLEVELKTYHENLPQIDCVITIRLTAQYGKISYITAMVQDVSWVSRTKKKAGVLEMAGKTCHEFSQPAQAISGYTQLLSLEMKKKQPDMEKIFKFISTIQDQNEKLSALLVKTHDIISTAKYVNKKAAIKAAKLKEGTDV
jgi:signal transduction histidine kinase